MNKMMKDFQMKSALRMAHGGSVRGPGGPTDDKIPVMMSDGEYVLPAETVKKVSPQKLDELVKKTTGRKPSVEVASNGLRKFQTGGLMDDEFLRRATRGIEVAEDILPDNTNVAANRARDMAAAESAAARGSFRAVAPTAATAAAKAPLAQRILNAKISPGAGLRGVASGAATVGKAAAGVNPLIDAVAVPYGAVQGAYESAFRPDIVRNFEANTGVETPLGAVGANALRTLGNIGNAATFGVADRLGQGISNYASGGSFAEGFIEGSDSKGIKPTATRVAAAPTIASPAGRGAMPAAAASAVDPFVERNTMNPNTGAADWKPQSDMLARGSTLRQYAPGIYEGVSAAGKGAPGGGRLFTDGQNYRGPTIVSGPDPETAAFNEREQAALFDAQYRAANNGLSREENRAARERLTQTTEINQAANKAAAQFNPRTRSGRQALAQIEEARINQLGNLDRERMARSSSALRDQLDVRRDAREERRLKNDEDQTRLAQQAAAGKAASAAREAVTEREAKASERVRKLLGPSFTTSDPETGKSFFNEQALGQFEDFVRRSDPKFGESGKSLTELEGPELDRVVQKYKDAFLVIDAARRANPDENIPNVYTGMPNTRGLRLGDFSPFGPVGPIDATVAAFTGDKPLELNGQTLGLAAQAAKSSRGLDEATLRYLTERNNNR